MKPRLMAGLSVLVLTVVVSMALCSFLTGCEEAKGAHALTVVPSYLDLRTGGTNAATQTFVVTNGLRELSLPLEWSVSNPELGRIVSGGNSASYITYTDRHGDNTIYVKDQYDAEGVATVRQ